MTAERVFAAGALAAALGMGLPATAQAATGFSVTSYAVGGAQDSFAAFDPGLGTLLSVHIELSGDIVPLILSDSTAQLEPLFITQTFTGFAGKGFSTQTAATITGSLLTTSPDAPGIAIAPYHNAWTFDAVSDAAGFSADSYGSTYSGHVSDFLAGGPSGTQIIEFPTLTAWALGVSGAQLFSLNTFLSGGGLVTYTYELPAPPPGAPEPDAWVMLLSGFALLGAQARRRRARAA